MHVYIHAYIHIYMQHGDMRGAARDIAHLERGADALELRVDLLDAKDHDVIRRQVSEASSAYIRAYLCTVCVYIQYT
jgi:3-dehydroquinate dehydratase